MKTLLTLGCLIGLSLVVTVTAFDRTEGADELPVPPSAADDPAVAEIRRELHDAVESKRLVVVIVHGEQYTGFPTAVSRTTVMIQMQDPRSRTLMRLDKISGVVLVNFPDEIEAATKVLEEASEKRKLGSAAVKVTGMVTLDGKPLGGARIYFNKQGSHSTKTTINDDGTYELSNGRLDVDRFVGKYDVVFDPGSSDVEIPASIQSRRRIVKVRAGENSINFDLTSE